MEAGAKDAKLNLSRPGELIVRAVACYRADWRRLTPVVAIYAFGGLAFQLLFESGFRVMPQFLLPLGAVFMLAGAFLYVWGFTAILLALKNERLDWQGAYQGALSYVVRYAVIWFLYSLVVLAGIILLVLPGIYWAVQFSLVSYALVFENAGVREAFRKSKMYVRGHWWAVLRREAALGIILMGAYLFALLIFGILLLSDVAQGLLLAALNSAVVPITSVYVLLMYRELIRLHHGKNSD